MKQSKYSKRRPADGKAYLQKDAGKGFKPVTHVIKSKPPTRLNEYELGIFIDDERSLEEVSLPKAKNWVILRSYSEVDEYLEECQPVESAFISFDHYLIKTDGYRFNGDDCSNLCYLFRENIADRIDIQGHSSDPSMNDDKLDRWYGDTN